MYWYRATGRQLRELTMEEFDALREEMPWVAEPVESLSQDTRTCQCMRRGNIAFVGELVQHTEWELLRIQNLGRKTLGLIKGALAQRGLQLGIRLADEGSVILKFPRIVLADPFPGPLVIPAPRNPTEELLLAGILPMTPWQECLDVQVGTAHVLLANGVDYVGEVIAQIFDGRLSPQTMSPEWFQDLKDALGRLGVGRKRPGPVMAEELPDSLPAVCELALTHLAERQAAVLIRHYLHGEALKDIADEWSVTYGRVAQLRARAAERIPMPFKRKIRDGTRNLTDALEEECLLHRERVFELARCRDMRYIRLALAIIGVSNCRIDRSGGLCLVGRSTARPVTE